MTARTTASRHIAAYVAQYIHELSERHEKDRETVTAVVGHGAGVPQTA